MSEREADSKRRLKQVWDMVWAIYLFEEKKYSDNWRDIEWDKVWRHFKGELEEIRDSKTLKDQIHNICDAIGLLTILCSKIIVEETVNVLGYKNFEVEDNTPYSCPYP